MRNFTELDLPVPINLYEQWCEIKTAHNITNAQVSVTNIKGHTNDPYFGTGSLIYDWANKTEDAGGNRVVPKFENPYRETDFDTITDIFMNTGFEDAVEIARRRFGKLGRVRVMHLMPNRCLSWHIDTEPRLHLPLKTNDKCFMVIDDEVRHLEENKWCFTDTTKHHTVFNGSNETRTHLVFSIV